MAIHAGPPKAQGSNPCLLAPFVSCAFNYFRSKVIFAIGALIEAVKAQQHEIDELRAEARALSEQLNVSSHRGQQPAPGYNS